MGIQVVEGILSLFYRLDLSLLSVPLSSLAMNLTGGYHYGIHCSYYEELLAMVYYYILEWSILHFFQISLEHLPSEPSSGITGGVH